MEGVRPVKLRFNIKEQARKATSFDGYNATWVFYALRSPQLKPIKSRQKLHFSLKKKIRKNQKNRSFDTHCEAPKPAANIKGGRAASVQNSSVWFPV